MGFVDEVLEGVRRGVGASDNGDARVDAVKRKARTLIDRAWNRALNDAAAEAGRHGAPPEALKAIMALRREVR